MGDFSVWLSSKLTELKLDEDIFLTYITAILEGYDSRDEKLEALTSVLEICADTEKHCEEILEQWEEVCRLENERKKGSAAKVESALSKLLETKATITNPKISAEPTQSSLTPEQLKIKSLILSQYGGKGADSEEELENDEETSKKSDSLPGVEKNINAFAIHQAEKEKRQIAKMESQKKKEQDKEAREKHKLNAQEKKEARRKKAQKVERKKM